MNFMQGTLDVLILTSLADSPRHGYDVVEWIRRETEDTLRIDRRRPLHLTAPHGETRLARA
jgi:DNA-binding PadR family transcriptional regulator